MSKKCEDFRRPVEAKNQCINMIKILKKLRKS